MESSSQMEDPAVNNLRQFHRLAVLSQDVGDTIGTTESQTVTLDVTEGLTAGDLHVWQSTENAQFVQQADLVPAADGTYTLTVPADAVVSVTTTTGQNRGDAAGKVDSAFPFPYSDSLAEGGPSGQTPYFSQMEGAFEIRDC
jgi:hypothetical protein